MQELFTPRTRDPTVLTTYQECLPPPRLASLDKYATESLGKSQIWSRAWGVVVVVVVVVFFFSLDSLSPIGVSASRVQASPVAQPLALKSTQTRTSSSTNGSRLSDRVTFSRSAGGTTSRSREGKGEMTERGFGALLRVVASRRRRQAFARFT